jgi:beta-lactamase superfamily II metal-dependent hydrolase
VITIKFKDVGQGDATILEWLDDSENKCIGIIDCCKKNGNPILKHLKLLKISKINFIIISHFHEDHYSGLLEILTYCEQNEIIIETLQHTGQPTVFTTFMKIGSVADQILLSNTHAKIEELIDKKIILDPCNISNKNVPISLTKKISLSFLSPYYADYTFVINQAKKIMNGKSIHIDYNRVSAITKIYSEKKYILLPADSTVESHERAEKLDDCVKSKSLILSQAPHHGSEKNFSLKFWGNRQREAKCPFVFTVGETVHKLPKRYPVEEIDNLKYDVFSTNYVNGIQEVFPNTNSKQIAQSVLSILDTMSPLIDETKINTISKYVGDKEFTLDLVS